MVQSFRKPSATKMAGFVWRVARRLSFKRLFLDAIVFPRSASFRAESGATRPNLQDRRSLKRRKSHGKRWISRDQIELSTSRRIVCDAVLQVITQQTADLNEVPAVSGDRRSLAVGTLGNFDQINTLIRDGKLRQQ